MRAAVVVALLIAMLAVVYLARRPRPAAITDSQTPTNAIVQAGASRLPPDRRITPKEDTLADPQDPEFVQRMVPVVREFFGTLDRAGVNPLKEELSFNSIQMHHGPNGTTCRLLLGDSWTATTYVGPNYSGVLHFGQRGPDNPFRAISHANTNALMRLSQKAIQMPKVEAERIISRVSDAFQVNRARFEEPEIYPDKMFDYDLGMYSVQYRTKGTDPVNQLNYALSFSIRATSPTTAVLVSYMYDGRGGR
jgi:hypothetical protein